VVSRSSALSMDARRRVGGRWLARCVGEVGEGMRGRGSWVIGSLDGCTLLHQYEQNRDEHRGVQHVRNVPIPIPLIFLCLVLLC
jgi:hypothetical protein